VKLTYQALNFDYGRARSILDRFDLDASIRGALDTVVIGDPSCTFRLEHMLGDAAARGGWRRLRDHVRGAGRALLLQLPVTVKQGEWAALWRLCEALQDDVDGWICGDIGFLARLAESAPAKTHVLHADIANPAAAEVAQAIAPVAYVRPRFLRRSLLEADANIARDVIAYGHMLLSCSTFCVHCGDLPSACDFSCAVPKRLEMESELVHLVGRALVTERRIDLLDMLGDIPGATRATLFDLKLGEEELIAAARVIASTQSA